MTAQGEDILAFLDRAINTREASALAAADETENDWTDGGEFGEAVHAVAHGGVVAVDPYGYMSDGTRSHIALNDPASVLRRCAADRKILSIHRSVPNHGRYSEPECPADCDGQHNGPPVCMSCRGYAGDPLDAPCETVLAIAEGYGWKTDALQSWRSLRVGGRTEGER